MSIRLTEEQWADVLQACEVDSRQRSRGIASFVLLRADVYERFKSLFEEDPVTEQQVTRLTQRDRKVFGELLDNPSTKPNDALVKAARRYKMQVG